MNKDTIEAGYKQALAAVGGNELMLAEVVTALANAGMIDGNELDSFDAWLGSEGI